MGQLPGTRLEAIKTGATDGVTKLYIMFNAAKANNRTVNVFIDDASQLITIAYLN
ncbi:hypothetical protein [Noviherbaspirillum aridicola]|uniref:Uncharacterized protein n=1 Tax=Noviherbaspirillum aridicola TaxID=2849687 RepID=A0ABQ4Q7P6_9BURK|nr:hypothetical protein [Noviherbaspirillum aridicola]GIZ52835.1 hypothetical protein NCCP691_28490 [Noviherbaspirillum aridicola]